MMVPEGYAEMSDEKLLVALRKTYGDAAEYVLSVLRGTAEDDGLPPIE